MSKNPNVEKAALLVANGYIHRGLAWVSIAEALDAAGLLVTPLHERALEACKAYAHEYDTSHCAGVVTARRTDVITLGREALALEKPKERWGPVEREFLDDRGRFTVDDRETGARIYLHPKSGDFDFTEAQARAVAKALNECDK